MKALIAILVFTAGTDSWAQCACLCADGAPKTLCTTVEEAQAGPALCANRAKTACPLELNNHVNGQLRDAPVDGAVNCRSMWVSDSLRGALRDITVCNVLDQEAAISRGFDSE